MIQTAMLQKFRVKFREIRVNCITMRLQRKFGSILRTSVVNIHRQVRDKKSNVLLVCQEKEKKKVISPKCFLVTYLVLRMLEFVGIIKWGSKEISNAYKLMASTAY